MRWWLLIVVAVLSLWHPHHAKSVEFAYIGPGAGFAFLGSFLTLLGGFFLSVVSILSWPFRMVWRLVRGAQGYKHARIKKLIFLGLDGLDPTLAEKFMAAGKLPNLKKLQEQGGFRRLRTTFTVASPSSARHQAQKQRDKATLLPADCELRIALHATIFLQTRHLAQVET